MTKKKQPALKFGSPEVIKEYRRKNGLNQSEFWSRVGVTQSGGSRYESGRNIPRPVQLLLQILWQQCSTKHRLNFRRLLRA